MQKLKAPALQAAYLLFIGVIVGAGMHIGGRAAAELWPAKLGTIEVVYK